MKRERVEVRWDRQNGRWLISLKGGGTDAVFTKAEAVFLAANYCRMHASDGERRFELIIKNRNGQIGKGSSSRRTYGKDPRRTRG